MDSIAPEIEEELFAYVGGICNNQNSKLIAVGGTENHVHLLNSISKNIALPNLLGKIKRDSSKRIKTIRLSKLCLAGWIWSISVGHSQTDSLKKYIANQKKHHSAKSFEDELRYFSANIM